MTGRYRTLPRWTGWPSSGCAGTFRSRASPAGCASIYREHMPFSADTTAAVARARQHSIGDLLRRTAQRSPDKLAVVYGEQHYTFAEFDTAVNRAAGALAARGLAKGDRLALLGR